MKVEKVVVRQVDSLANIVSKLADYAIDKLVEFAKTALGRDVTADEVLRLLDEHPELLNFDLLDEAIEGSTIAKMLVNVALRLAGAIVKRKPEWVNELKTKRSSIVIKMLQKYNKVLYELLKDKPNVVEFLTDYVIYKLGV